MKAGQRLQPGHLMTGEERRILRDTQRDLERRIERARRPGLLAELMNQLGSIERERQHDRDLRRQLPRKAAKGKSKKRGRR